MSDDQDNSPATRGDVKAMLAESTAQIVATVAQTVAQGVAQTGAIMQQMWLQFGDALRTTEKNLVTKLETATAVSTKALAALTYGDKLDEHEERLGRLESHLGLKPL